MVRSTFALAAVLSVASASLAADLATSPVFVGTQTCALCKLVNITSAPIPARVQMIADGGAVLRDSDPATVEANAVLEVEQCPVGGKFVFCRFVNASKSKVRANLNTFLGGDFSDTLVVPAQ
jgi:hypothetical protein